MLSHRFAYLRPSIKTYARIDRLKEENFRRVAAHSEYDSDVIIFRIGQFPLNLTEQMLRSKKDYVSGHGSNSKAHLTHHQRPLPMFQYLLEFLRLVAKHITANLAASVPHFVYNPTIK